ncbi:hypothetical protein CLCR_02492 [Cladophialophora carrionii]|uniref:BTB domain-containing protein n=1 Tax=Cladophialophora carrionii TaxID=86049 RepID=A0A1C1CEU2_9EURO|nr:hypothetical protein CLCR_02492 [Cladophialophora carrionii]
MARKRKAKEIDTPEDQPHPKVIEVVPNADATFKVGTGKDALEVKVSGMVMGLASPVLSRMLFGQFVEAETKTVSQEVVASWLYQRTGLVRGYVHWKKVVEAQAAIACPSSSPYPVTPTKTESFFLRDLIDICAILSFVKDFWYATRQNLALCPCDSTTTTGSGLKIPSMVNPDGETVYDVAAKIQTRYVNAFLKDVFDCLGEGIESDSSLLSCQTTKHGMLHLLLRKHGIVPADMVKPQSMRVVMGRLSVLAEELKDDDKGPTKNSCNKEKSTPRAKRGKAMRLLQS